MDHSARFAADLAMLSGAIPKPGDGLESVLTSFVDDLRRAVNSFLGLTMTLAVDGHEISFTLTEHETPAGTSLHIPLRPVADLEGGSSLLLYAATPGAFVDLAADIAWILQLDPSALVLDGHLAMPASSDSVVGLREHATINRAIGALIEGGYTPESAGVELRRRADLDGGDIPAAAQRVLAGLLRPLRDPG